jgi:hypothetical protein
MIYFYITIFYSFLIFCALMLDDFLIKLYKYIFFYFCNLYYILFIAIYSSVKHVKKSNNKIRNAFILIFVEIILFNFFNKKINTLIVHCYITNLFVFSRESKALIFLFIIYSLFRPNRNKILTKITFYYYLRVKHKIMK